MSLYALQKIIRDVTRLPAARDAYAADAAAFAAGYDLSPEERRAFVARDITRLYALGVHGLLLRPFTLLQKMPEPEYLAAIRREA